MESFTARGRHDGGEWVVTVSSPQNFSSVQGRGHSRTEAKDDLTDLLALTLGHRNFSVQVSFEEEIRG